MDNNNCAVRRLRTFENKICRIISQRVRDISINEQRKKFNKEVQEELCLAPVTIVNYSHKWTKNTVVRPYYEKKKLLEKL